MDDSSGAVPRQAHVPFHVGIVDDKFAVGVEIEIVAVAVTDGEHVPRFSAGIGFHDVTTRGHPAAGMAVRVPNARQQ